MTTNVIVEPEIKNILNEYFRLIDAALPGTIEGFYIVGSIALNDYISRVSDIDFVAVSSEGLTEPELDLLTGLHLKLAETARSPKLDGIYTTWSALARTTDGATAHHWLDQDLHRDSLYGANPVTWATIQKHPVVVRGNPKPEVFHSDFELREWCKGNLRSYWTNWVNASRRFGPKYFASFTQESVCWGVLGVVRLHATIRTGEIISKTQAYEYGCTAFEDEWHSILRIALSGRRAQTKHQRMTPFGRRSKALGFMEHAIADAVDLDAKSKST